MVVVKRLYTFVLQRFLPVLTMTFFICLFIVMMQFLWRSVDDIIGKGLGFSVIAELFWYAALSMVPTALPLAVLLASLMTFGNLGEKFELTAMKAAGISLFRIMRPLIIFIVLLATGAFFFQNDVLPIAQTKMWTLLFSMRQKSPEVEIPEGTFYDQIPGMNLYVEHKDLESGMLHDLIIYDVTRGMDNARVILADSGKLNFTEDKRYLYLHLYQGELFENFRDNSFGVNNAGYMPFRRETFDDKQVYIAFDANFNRIDEQAMRSQYIGKNIAELNTAIDSLNRQVDSIGTIYGTDIQQAAYFGVPYYERKMVNGEVVQQPQHMVHPRTKVNIDSILAGRDGIAGRSYIAQALAKSKRYIAEFEFKSLSLVDQQKLMRRHDIERQKKFTLSFACIIFFFIGAPLGAIIKKGGLGTPLVISVALFVFYYIFDNMGYKMARDGKMAVWQGIWLSSAVMLPLGVFFTYKAVGDSAVFDFDSWKRHAKSLLRIPQKRLVPLKEIVMTHPDIASLTQRIEAFMAQTQSRCEAHKKAPVYKRPLTPVFTPAMKTDFDELVNDISYVIDKKTNAYLNELPVDLGARNANTVITLCNKIIARLNNLTINNDEQQHQA